MNEIEETMVFSFEFISPTKIVLEETARGVAIISGTLLSEGISRNGNLYTIEEIEHIAKQGEDQPIYTGTMTKIDPNTGLLCKNLHANIEQKKIGRIIRTWLEGRKIKFLAEIVNTLEFPDIVNKVKTGWGISIGGVATKAKQLWDKISNRIITKIKDLTLQHVQLLEPQVSRGQETAQVETVKVQETMVFYQMPKRRIIEVTLGLGISSSD